VFLQESDQTLTPFERAYDPGILLLIQPNTLLEATGSLLSAGVAVLMFFEPASFEIGLDMLDKEEETAVIHSVSLALHQPYRAFL